MNVKLSDLGFIAPDPDRNFNINVDGRISDFYILKKANIAKSIIVIHTNAHALGLFPKFVSDPPKQPSIKMFILIFDITLIV